MLKTLRTAPVLSPSSSNSTIRQMVESLVLLAVAVVIFRAFAVEGYLISTGSMAPTLLGYHHEITCPECSFTYAHTAPADEDSGTVERAWAEYEIGLPPISNTRCPNCGFRGISLNDLPRTEGDQLLVHKLAYEFRDPRRWEVIVFRNPGDPRQAYVKRVVGLPGEEIEIRNGDVLIDGKLARKPYKVQQAVKIPVSNYASQVPADDPDCRPSWVLLNQNSRWSAHAESLSHQLTTGAARKTMHWVGHRHWVRQGGSHLTSVEMTKWPEDLMPLAPAIDRLHYEDGLLSVTGVLTDFERRAWLTRSDDPGFHQAIQDLFQQSHIAPITDEYGYNSVGGQESHPLSEFFVSLTLADVTGQGRFEIELSDGEQIFSVVFNFEKNTVELLRNGDPVPLRTRQMESKLFAQPVQIDFSLIDDQAVLGINGAEYFEPFVFTGDPAAKEMRRSTRFGAAGIGCVVTKLGLHRDLYYTSKDSQKHHRYKVDRDEFFVLGDNSPVSVDSRVWPDPAVPRAALIGKPLVVHLPSRTKRLSWGGEIHNIRIPDFSQVRLIR